MFRKKNAFPGSKNLKFRDEISNRRAMFRT